MPCKWKLSTPKTSRSIRRRLPVLLVGQKATTNFGPDYKAAFDDMYPALAEAHGALLQPYVFEGIEAAMDAGAAGRTDLFQADGIHPNARGVTLNVAAMGPYVLELIDEVTAP